MMASPARVCVPSMISVFFDEADAETREVVILAVVHARHFGGFAADERATGLQAPLDDALDHAFGRVDIELAGRVVVEEKQRLGALHDDVVHAHRDQVDADRVVPAGLDGQPQLGADAIGSRHHDGPLISIERHLDQCAEAADAAQHLAAASSA